jgi:hypothetical protein
MYINIKIRIIQAGNVINRIYRRIDCLLCMATLVLNVEWGKAKEQDKSDGCSWGDPIADWTMLLLHIKETEGTSSDELAGVQAFWQGYGQPEHSQGALFREQVYYAGHFAQGRLDRYRQGRDDIVLRTYDKVREITATLRDIVQAGEWGTLPLSTILD